MENKNNVVQIFVNNEEIDLFKDNLGIRLSDQLLDPTKILSKSGSYSYTFSLPATAKNNRIFGFINVASKMNKFAKTYRCQVFNDNLTIFDGNLAINEYSNKNKEYSVNLFLNKKNTIDEIFGDTNLNQVDWIIDFNGVDTINDVNADMTTKYFFPIVAYSLFNKYPKETTESGYKIYGKKNEIDTATKFYYQSFPASLNMVELLNKCFKKKNLSLQGDIMSDNILNEIYLSTNLASGQDPEYNIGGNMGKLSFNFTFQNWTKDTMQLVNPTRYMDMVEYPFEVPFEGKDKLKNYDTVFAYPIWDENKNYLLGDKEYVKLSDIVDEGKMFSRDIAGIKIPQDGWYEIELGLTYSVDAEQTEFTAFQTTGITMNGNDETKSYGNVTIKKDIEHMPVEVQILRYDADDGDTSVLNHTPTGWGIYPNEKKYNKLDSSGYTNVEKEYIGEVVTTQVSPFANENYIMGTAMYEGANSLGYVRNGYDINSNAYDEAIYECPGYYKWMIDDNGRKTYVKSDYNKLSMANHGWIHDVNDIRLTAVSRQRMIVKLHKNDVLTGYIQQRAYFDEDNKRLPYKIRITDGHFNLRAVSQYITLRDKINWGMTSTFPTKLNLNQFINKETKMKDFINNVLKSFNLSFYREGDSVFINKNKISKKLTNCVDIDKKCNVNDSEFSRIDFPNSMQVKFQVDTEEEGFYLSAEKNATDEQLQSTSWKDYGDYGSKKITILEDGAANDLIETTNFSYNWFKDFKLLRAKDWWDSWKASNVTETYNDINLSIIGKSSWWIEGKSYEEDAKNDGYGFKQRFWFRGEQVNDDNWIVPCDNRIWLSYGLTGNDGWYKFTTCTGIKTIDGKTIYLNYNLGENTILGKYFNIDVNSQGNEVDIEVYLNSSEYHKLKSGMCVKFDDDIYQVMKIDGYDISGQNPTKLKLIKL